MSHWDRRSTPFSYEAHGGACLPRPHHQLLIQQRTVVPGVGPAFYTSSALRAGAASTDLVGGTRRLCLGSTRYLRDGRSNNPTAETLPYSGQRTCPFGRQIDSRDSSVGLSHAVRKAGREPRAKGRSGEGQGKLPPVAGTQRWLKKGSWSPRGETHTAHESSLWPPARYARYRGLPETQSPPGDRALVLSRALRRPGRGSLGAPAPRDAPDRQMHRLPPDPE